jgi:hypothetical protein
MRREAEQINSTQERCHSNVPERFRKPLMKVAYKHLSRDEATFEELTPSEQKLWNSFETDQIYRLLTGEPDTVPKFRFNWYTVDTTDRYCKQPQRQPALRTPAPASRTTVRAPTPAPVPAPTVKPPKASTSARDYPHQQLLRIHLRDRVQLHLHPEQPLPALFQERNTPRVLTPPQLQAQPPIQHPVDHRHHHRCRHQCNQRLQSQQKVQEDCSDFDQM